MAFFSTPNGGGFIFASGDVGGSGTTTNTVIASPSFSLVNYTSASMTYEHAFRRISGDLAKVEVSTDGGLTYPTEIIASTPNDGSEALTIPAVPASTSVYDARPVASVASADDAVVALRPVTVTVTGEFATAAPN